MPVGYEFLCRKCNYIKTVYAEMKKGPPKIVRCKEGHVMDRIYSLPSIVFKGDGWPSKDIKRNNDDGKLFRKARIARRMKASGAVPMGARIRPEDVDETKFHGDLSKKELREGRCNYDGLTPRRKNVSEKARAKGKNRA